MQLKRPGILLVERREQAEFSLPDLLGGGAGMVGKGAWIALAPHLGREVELELADLGVLDAMPPEQTLPFAELAERFGEPSVSRLVAAGLLLNDQPEHEALRARDQLLRDTCWWAPAAVVQAFGRWQDIDVAAEEARSGRRTLEALIEANGPPPDEAPAWRTATRPVSLPKPAQTQLDDLLQRRATCRNFDSEAVLPLSDLATVLHRVFGAQATETLASGTVMLKKNSPSGGGLHPIEAFVLVRRVEGLSPGLYHYLSTGHALEPMQLLSDEAVEPLARELVAGQHWFANAPVQILMAARFQRNFWKYRNHAKSWKVVQLDAGHLSQTLYLGATELGYGAFVTAAINDECAERLFELDGLAVGAIAVCGFGPRSPQAANIEFDPLGKAVR